MTTHPCRQIVYSLVPITLPLVSREWKNGSNSSYNCTPFLHSLLTKGKLQALLGPGIHYLGPLVTREKLQPQTQPDQSIYMVPKFPHVLYIQAFVVNMQQGMYVLLWSCMQAPIHSQMCPYVS